MMNGHPSYLFLIAATNVNTLVAADKKSGIIVWIYPLGIMNVCAKCVPIHLVDGSENDFDLLVVLKDNEGITKVSRLHPLGNTTS